MMILAYYFFIGLFSSTSGQPVLSLSDFYVNKPKPVILTCTVDGAISGPVVILKDGTSVYRCLSPLLPCTNLVGVDAYSAVQNKSAGTTTMTISASNVSRDTGNWTCQYGSTNISGAVSLTVGTLAYIAKMDELNTTVVIETTCIFPYADVAVLCLLGGKDINCKYNVSSSDSTCSDSSERVLMITIDLSVFKGKASGYLTVNITNGFVAVSKTGSYNYSFTASAPSSPGDQSALKLGIGLGLGIPAGLGITVVIVILAMKRKDKGKKKTGSHPALTPEDVALQKDVE